MIAALALLAAWADPGMVDIPAGEFQRGRTFEWADYEVAYYPRVQKDDRPVRTLRISAFQLDISEVTNERYAEFARKTGHRVPYHWRKGQFAPNEARHPVANVSHDDARAYCAAQGKRLPTEAEWERAARGGLEAKMYSWGDDKPTAKLARYGSDATVEVCTTARNGFGLCDMTGNVWEWTADWWALDYYAKAPDTDPPGPAQGMYRVLRGGSYFDEPPLFLSVAYRSWARPAERSRTIGFRCAK